MTGVVRRNPDRQMFMFDGQLILKNFAAGNIDQRFAEANDWVLGDVGNGIIAIMGKYDGNGNKVPANFDMDSSINTNNFPDV
ncbi:hypothetical protein [Flagellimonas marina]|uniref:Uncharacterized protein n=1 Tax=Flagellimonas marina TaxID=1775168 RepID=A0ABV8PJE7_9FLAO